VTAVAKSIGELLRAVDIVIWHHEKQGGGR
jgi:hypothetical protein